MATQGRNATTPVKGTLAYRVYHNGTAFDFFQAVRMLERMDAERRSVGRDGPPQQEAVRFKVHVGLEFPASSIQKIEPPRDDIPPAMTVTFFGLTGPLGVLPRHYTELLMRQQRDVHGEERYVLRDWFDLFNHRLISLFFRAWEKYRFFIAYERGEHARTEPDTFTAALYSFVGLGFPELRNRLRISYRDEAVDMGREQVLAKIDDLAVLYYAGLFAHRPRNAIGLEALLTDYFRMPVKVREFEGQWLALDRQNQSSIGVTGYNLTLGRDAVAGDRVYDVRSKFRVILGPLSYEQFVEFLPDRNLNSKNKGFFLLVHLVRLYVDATLSFDVQLILRKQDVPNCQLEEDTIPGPRLGWNSWLATEQCETDMADAAFEAEEVFQLEKAWLL